MPGNKPKFVYTPMHGVGLKIFEQVMHSIGFQGSMHPVPEQVARVNAVTDNRPYPIQTFQPSNSPILRKKVVPSQIH
jgi:phosphomannomutase